MAVIPIEITPDGVVVQHQERGHGALAPWSAVRFGAQAGTREYDRTVLLLPCPACGGETAHPLGDAAPELVRAVAAELDRRTPAGPRPPTDAEQAEADARGQRATRLARLDQDIAGYAGLTAAERAAATLNGLVVLRAVVKRLMGE